MERRIGEIRDEATRFPSSTREFFEYFRLVISVCSCTLDSLGFIGVAEAWHEQESQWLVVTMGMGTGIGDARAGIRGKAATPDEPLGSMAYPALELPVERISG